MPRYRFAEFVLSPRRRLLLRDGREQPLIPRYFDLLVFLVERRHEAVHRREIFDRVWSDVIVSDSALSQAIRTIRRALDDDPREPRFVRTVSRHGYRFVFPEVAEEDDYGTWPSAPEAPEPEPAVRAVAVEDTFEPLLQRVSRPARDAAEREDQREAAEILHGLGTAEALRRLGARHLLIRPHCPWQNGKVERFNRTLQAEWAYAQVFTSNAQRAGCLPDWLNHYNTRRRHSSLKGRPPTSRLSTTC